jgi:hypothetical protein
MTILAALLFLLISWTTFVAVAVTRMPELGIDLFVIAMPIAALIAATSKPSSWRTPSVLWIPAVAASHAALRTTFATGVEPTAASVAGGVVAIGVGLWLGWETGARIRRLEDALEGIVDASPELPEMHGKGQEAMIREMRRARRHRRPLSVLSLVPARPIRREELDRILSEMRRSAVDHYTDARLASLLVERVDTSSIVTKEGDHFVVLLAETDRNEAQQAVARIEHEFSKELGISVRCGISSFPDEETTLTGLLETSELEMRRTQAWVDSTQESTEP